MSLYENIKGPSLMTKIYLKLRAPLNLPRNVFHIIVCPAKAWSGSLSGSLDFRVYKELEIDNVKHD